MEYFSKFLQNPTTNSTIIIVVAIVVIIPNIPKIAKYLPILKSIFSTNTTAEKISHVQDEKYGSIEKHLKTIEGLYNENKKFQENHSMHEIPEIKREVGSINLKLDKFLDTQIKHGQEIAYLKAKIDNKL